MLEPMDALQEHSAAVRSLSTTGDADEREVAWVGVDPLELRPPYDVGFSLTMASAIVVARDVATARSDSVEDNVVNQTVASGILARLGCRVDVAADGAVAVEMSRLGRYDLIFMDVHMPWMDGFEATAAIRKREAEVRGCVPFINAVAVALGRELSSPSGEIDGCVRNPERE